MSERRWTARAYRGGQVICDKVELCADVDTRIGLAPHERQYVSARFVGQTAPALRAELYALVCRRGARAKRFAEHLEPITFAGDDLTIVGALQPPQMRVLSLHLREVTFRVHQRRVSPAVPVNRALAHLQSGA
jgi:hypothetical protein